MKSRQACDQDCHLVAWMGLPRDWGSGCGGDCGERVVRGEEALPEAGAERAVVDGAADLEQPIGTAPRPAHLLRFVHATIDEEVGRSLGQRRANPQPGPMPFAIVDQPIALPDEVAVQRLQRGPQLARGRDGSAAAGLATEWCITARMRSMLTFASLALP